MAGPPGAGLRRVWACSTRLLGCENTGLGARRTPGLLAPGLPLPGCRSWPRSHDIPEPLSPQSKDGAYRTCFTGLFARIEAYRVHSTWSVAPSHCETGNIYGQRQPAVRVGSPGGNGHRRGRQRRGPSLLPLENVLTLQTGGQGLEREISMPESPELAHMGHNGKPRAQASLPPAC